ncbi:hypothetical protein RI065_00620 [Mycoplasmatota bacterium zrk1]
MRKILCFAIVIFLLASFLLYSHFEQINEEKEWKLCSEAWFVVSGEFESLDNAEYRQIDGVLQLFYEETYQGETMKFYLELLGNYTFMCGSEIEKKRPTSNITIIKEYIEITNIPL